MFVSLARILLNCRHLQSSCKVGVKVRNYSPLLRSLNKLMCCQVRYYAASDKPRAIVQRDIFQNIQDKNRETYINMLNIYKTEVKRKTGHVEFIYSALKHMKEFGVEKDLEVYKSLIDIFPKGKMVPRNLFQAEFMHYPKDQQCGIDLLEQMEENGVMPSWDMEDQLVNIFGRRGYPVRRYWRMMYWMPKFKNASPWLLPFTVPSDAYQLAMLAIQRIASVDPTSEITVFKSSEVKDSIEDTWIISAQSPDQMRLLDQLPDETPLYVEGRYRIWLRNKSVTYFVLRADVHTKIEYEENTDDVSNLKIPFFCKPNYLPRKKVTVHEQEDGIIFAVCSTGTSGRDSLLSWIRLLEKKNPRLGKLPVVFTLRSAPSEDELISLDENDSVKIVK